MADSKSDIGKGALASSFAGLPLKALIGAPLKAASDANAMISKSQAQFILSACFEKSSEGKMTPIMIDFTLTRHTLDKDGGKGQPVSMQFSIPLLTLLPISSLAVEKLKISFEMDVRSSSHYSNETSKDIKNSTDNNVPDTFKSHQFNTEMHGALATKSTSGKKSDAHYQIELEAGSLPLPVGMKSILDIFSKNISPIPTKNEPQKN